MGGDESPRSGRNRRKSVVTNPKLLVTFYTIAKKPSNPSQCWAAESTSGAVGKEEVSSAWPARPCGTSWPSVSQVPHVSLSHTSRWSVTAMSFASERWRDVHRLHQSALEAAPPRDGAGRDPAAVHLRCPQGGEPGRHDGQEDVLLPAAGCHQAAAHQQHHHGERGDPGAPEEIHGGG